MKVRIRSILSPPLLSPGGLIVRAAWLWAAYLAAHIAGLREATSIICGTMPTGTPEDPWRAALGAGYVILYLAAVLAAPVLALAGVLFAALIPATRTIKGTGRQSPAAPVR